MAKKKLHLSQNPWKILLQSTLICFVLGAVFFGIALREIERPTLSHQPLVFNEQRAFNDMVTLSKKFPDRLPWHKNRLLAANWIKNSLIKSGYKPKEMVFSEVIDGKNYTDLTNVYAIKKGTTFPDEIIAVAAHFDTTDTTKEGAMDDASGVGVVLELARVFSKIETKRTLLFLLTDSEEFGAFWGATNFAQSFKDKDKIIALANFDFVGPHDQVAILTLCDGLKQGYTPLWLREMALDSLRSIKRVKVVDFTHFVEMIERAMLIPPADHGAFLAAGIPSFNWVGQTNDFSGQMANIHHTLEDRAEIMKPQSFKDYGQAAERLLYSLDELAKVPEDHKNSSYLKITPQLYLDGWGVTILHILSFIPFILFSIMKFKPIYINRRKPIIKSSLKNEVKKMAFLLGSLLSGYAFLRLMPALKIITEYEVFPATQKSIILDHPNIFAISLVILITLIVYFLLNKVFTEKDDLIKNFEVRHAVNGLFLTIVIIFGFIGNSYLTFLLLLPPAYFWTLLNPPVSTKQRIKNFFLILGGTSTFIILIIALSTIFHIGVSYWYIFLSTAYGLISVYSAVTFFMALTVMIRLLRGFVFTKV